MNKRTHIRSPKGNGVRGCRSSRQQQSAQVSVTAPRLVSVTRHTLRMRLASKGFRGGVGVFQRWRGMSEAPATRGFAGASGAAAKGTSRCTSEKYVEVRRYTTVEAKQFGCSRSDLGREIVRP